MSAGDDGRLSAVQPEERNPLSSGQLKISYTRDFLLSLSGLEVCKTLPKGFDEALLSEFESSSLQSFRRNDYGSSPPGKGEMGNFSRGPQRWDSRASGRSDTDSQSDRDSDSGRRYGNQPRKPWQNPEHDGLLGSGSFPRPPGFGTGASVPRFRANDQQQLSRSSEPYQPPRPYKAPHSRRETKDSLNDETFGWAESESTSEDRAEEERKRRAEFEMMRKEQHRELQEKQKLKAMDRIKDDPLAALAASLDTVEDVIVTDGLDSSSMKPIQQNEPAKISVSSQGHSSRPLVPPGFATAAVEKISGTKPLTNSGSSEMTKLGFGMANQVEKSAILPGLGEQPSEATVPLANKASIPDDPSNILEIGEILENGKVLENVTGRKLVGESGRSTSILEKLFGGSLSIDGSGTSNIIEDQNSKTDDVWSPKDFHTSKFAHWFEEEKKPQESGSLEKSNDLLSLIVNEKSELVASETKTIQHILPLESNSGKVVTPTLGDAGISNALYNEKKPETVSTVLTCEDLEQSIFSNVSEGCLSAHTPGITSSQSNLENEIPKSDIDSNASLHLLSLLQKGSSSNSDTMSPFSMLDKGFSVGSKDSAGEKIAGIQSNSSDGIVENPNSGKGLTLETLFGTAFMKELHSADAPVSVQRDPAVSSSIHGFEPPMLLHSDSDSASEARFERVMRDGSDLHPGRDVLFPEEDSLTSLNVPVNAQGSLFMADHGKANSEMFPSHSSLPVNIAEKLAALGASVRDERPAYRQDNPPFPHGSFDMANQEVPYPTMHAQPSQQFNPTRANHGRPLFHPMDTHAAHIDPHSRFNYMQPEGIPRQEAPTHRQFPANLGHSAYQHANTGLSEYDHPLHPMLQQMHMRNNIPPPHLLPGFPGGAPPPHPGGNPQSYVQEQNLIQGFPFGHQQPNLGSHGMPLPGPEHGIMNNSPPQAFQRLLEMELRSNQKPSHPSFPAGGSHGRPMYGHELDTGFWQR